MRRSTLIRLISPALLVVALVGCVAKPKMDSPSTAPSADMVQALRETYKSAYPNAKIGVVSTVLTDDPYAMVTDIDTTGLKEKDYISFIDASQSVIASGEVVKVTANGIAVQFTPGTRAPQVGDAAVKF